MNVNDIIQQIDQEIESSTKLLIAAKQVIQNLPSKAGLDVCYQYYDTDVIPTAEITINNIISIILQQEEDGKITYQVCVTGLGMSSQKQLNQFIVIGLELNHFHVD